MKRIRSTLPAGTPDGAAAPLGRRGLVVAAGVAGVAAVAVHALRGAAVDATPAVVAKAVPEGEGYRLTPHVLRYYETTKA